MRKKFLVKQKYLLILKIKNKMKNLQEMSLEEMLVMEGGVIGVDDIIAGVIVGLTISAIDHWSDIKKGFYDATHNR